MIKGQQYFCEYVKNGKIKRRVSKFCRVKDGVVYLKNGVEIDEATGQELGTDDVRLWNPVTDEFKARRNVEKVAYQARKWFRKIMEIDDLTVTLYRRLNTEGTVDTRGYIHDLYVDDKRALRKQTVAFIKTHYRQPYWCGNQNALNGVFGCRKLMFDKKVTENKCLTCEFYVRDKTYDIYRRLRLLAGLKKEDVVKFTGIEDYTKIETGERRPNGKEMTMLQNLYGVDDWSMEQIEEFWDSREQTRRASDEWYKKYGTVLEDRINTESLVRFKKNMGI